MIDNINNKFSEIILFGVNRLLIVLLDINVKDIIIKKTLTTSVVDRDNGLFIVSPVSIRNNCI